MDNDNVSGETLEVNQARRQTYIDAGNVCNSNFCPFPQPDARGWCINCGYPVTNATRKSWEGSQSTDPHHQEILDKLKL